MKIHLIKGCILFILLCKTLFANAENTPLSGCILEKVNTSFLQLNNSQIARSSSEWESLFKQAHEMGIKHVIVQWSSYDNVLFYTKANYSQSLLFQVIKAAQKEQLSIIMGLNDDPKFWLALEGNDTQLQNYLNNQYKRQIEMMPDLLNTINAADPTGETVVGWYITNEIDDMHWQSESRQKILKNYLEQVIQMLKQQKQNWPINISTYSTGKASADQVAALYKFLFGISGINKILFQDSIGTKKLTLTSSEDYLKTIISQLNGNDGHFGIIVELFTANDDQISFESAPANRVLEQLKLAKKYSNSNITVFSIFTYVLPNDPHSKNSELYKFWQEQINHCKSLEIWLGVIDTFKEVARSQIVPFEIFWIFMTHRNLYMN